MGERGLRVQGRPGEPFDRLRANGAIRREGGFQTRPYEDVSGAQ